MHANGHSKTRRSDHERKSVCRKEESQLESYAYTMKLPETIKRAVED